MGAIKNPSFDEKMLIATRFNTKNFQLQRKNHFEISFSPSQEQKQQGFDIDPELKFMVVSFPLPKETTESNDISYFNQTIKTAGKTTFDSTTLVLRDAIFYDTELQFLNWRKRVYDPKTGRMGIAADYKVEATVKEYTPNGEEYRSWTLVGCWPGGIDYGELSYEDGGEKQLSITINYDYAYRNEER